MTTAQRSSGKISTDLLPLAFPIEKLDQLVGNPRRGSVEAVMASYAEFGQVKPVVARKKKGGRGRGEVIAGNHQLLAARELKWDSIAVVWVEMDDQRAKAFALADNRTADLGDYDDEALLAMVLAVADNDALFLASGYDDQYLKELQHRLAPPVVAAPDDVPTPVGDVQSQRGDVWLCGPHRVMCGDATDPDDVAKLMEGKVALLVWTDPPYGVDYTGGHQAKEAREGIVGDGDATLYAAALPQMMRHTADKAPFYLWFAGSEGQAVYDAVKSVNLEVRSQIIWNKLNPHYGAFMAQYMQRHEPCLYMHKRGKAPYWYGVNNEVSVWDVEQPTRNELHPTQKPVELAVRAITNSSKVGDLVLDPFGGSGTSLVACVASERVSRTMDVDPLYCDVICARYQKVTGDKPVLESTGEPHDFAVEEDV